MTKIITCDKKVFDINRQLYALYYVHIILISLIDLVLRIKLDFTFIIQRKVCFPCNLFAFVLPVSPHICVLCSVNVSTD